MTALPEFYRSNISVATGAIIGGVVNCIINYKFTFHADGQSIKAVSVKFLICWAGNLLLNMYGTTLLVMPLSRWEVLLNLGITNEQIFAITTFGVAVLVSIFWNFTVQKYFVYRPNRFDAFAIRLVDALDIFHHREKK
ncbi:MAG: GtrA family protein [Muribaculaceae bacterium]|nr:GtrA family protein [Muribaculaceae bacterium]